jgi:chromosome segregation ATPase
MRNLLTYILLAAIAILGFFAVQSSQQVSGLQADVAARTEAATALEGEKAALAAEVEKLKADTATAIQTATDAAAALQSERDALAGQVGSLEAEKAALGEELAGLQAELASVTDQVGALEAERATLTEELAGLEAEVAGLQAQIDAAAAAIAPAAGGATTTSP